MPEHDQIVHNFYNPLTPPTDEGYHPNFVDSTFGLEETPYLSELKPLIETSVNPILADSKDSFTPEIFDWQRKSVKSWTPHDIIQWVNDEARTLEVCCTEMAGEKLAQFDGTQLLTFSKDVFIQMDNRYGVILYQRLHEIASTLSDRQYQSLENVRTFKFDSEESLDGKSNNEIITSFDSITAHFTDFPLSPKCDNKNIGSDNHQRTKKSTPQQQKRNGPGRPKGSKRKKKPEKLGRLWEFLRDLLKNKEYCPSLIVWDNYEEGMFRFVHSDKVAKLWGTKKDNPDMNYEKLSRAMRYYYKSQVLQPVLGRRLVYKFGPTATGWRVDNPNFAE